MECYVIGDFNIDLLKYDICSKHKVFLNTMTSFGFLSHILQPSRIIEFSVTWIDNNVMLRMNAPALLNASPLPLRGIL